MKLDRLIPFLPIVYYEQLSFEMKLVGVVLGVLVNVKKIRNQLILFILLIAFALGIRYTFGSWLDTEGVGVFLLTLYFIKQFEVKDHRDQNVLFLISLLVIGVGALYASGFIAFIAVILHTLWLFWSRIRAVRPLLFAMLSSIPLLVLLFIFFPRFPNALVFESARQKSMVGFTDHLRLNLYDELELTNRVAMRIDAIKLPQLAYWRGEVLDLTDGLNWDATWPQAQTVLNADRGSGIPYSVELSRSYQSKIFLLEHSSGVKSDIVALEYIPESSIYRFFSKTKVMHYESWWTTSPLVESKLSTQQQQRYLAVPQASPKLRQLVDSLGNDFVRSARAYFVKNNFKYSLENVRVTTLDEFLFLKRKGFCAHYASSLAIMARLKGIPSRVVMGYLGFELVPSGNYFVVRDSDAHAWVELYLNGQWNRVDPTLWIANDRQMGGQFELRKKGQSDLVALWDEYSERINREWYHYFLSYDFSRQEQLAKNWSLDLPSFVLYGLWFGVILIIAIIAAILFREHGLGWFRLSKVDRYFHLLKNADPQDSTAQELWSELLKFRYRNAPSKAEFNQWLKKYRSNRKSFVYKK